MWPLRGSIIVLKVNSTGLPEALHCKVPPPSSSSAGISTALGATLSMKPMSRPLPMLRKALRQNTGKQVRFIMPCFNPIRISSSSSSPRSK